MRERKRERKRESKKDGGIEGEKYSGMEGSNGREWERGRENWYDFQGATSVTSCHLFIRLFSGPAALDYLKTL